MQNGKQHTELELIEMELTYKHKSVTKVKTKEEFGEGENEVAKTQMILSKDC